MDNTGSDDPIGSPQRVNGIMKSKKKGYSQQEEWSKKHHLKAKLGHHGGR